MEKGESISIVIPVYNVRKFLDKCLQQTYRNLEVVLVDDGLEDGSSEI